MNSDKQQPYYSTASLLQISKLKKVKFSFIVFAKLTRPFLQYLYFQVREG